MKYDVSAITSVLGCGTTELVASLNSNNIGVAGAEAIAAVLPSMSKLSELW